MRGGLRESERLGLALPVASRQKGQGQSQGQEQPKLGRGSWGPTMGGTHPAALQEEGCQWRNALTSVIWWDLFVTGFLKDLF